MTSSSTIDGDKGIGEESEMLSPRTLNDHDDSHCSIGDGGAAVIENPSMAHLFENTPVSSSHSTSGTVEVENNNHSTTCNNLPMAASSTSFHSSRSSSMMTRTQRCSGGIHVPPPRLDHLTSNRFQSGANQRLQGRNRPYFIDPESSAENEKLDQRFCCPSCINCWCGLFCETKAKFMTLLVAIFSILFMSFVIIVILYPRVPLFTVHKLIDTSGDPSRLNMIGTGDGVSFVALYWNMTVQVANPNFYPIQISEFIINVYFGNTTDVAIGSGNLNDVTFPANQITNPDLQFPVAVYFHPVNPFDPVLIQLGNIALKGGLITLTLEMIANVYPLSVFGYRVLEYSTVNLIVPKSSFQVPPLYQGVISGDS